MHHTLTNQVVLVTGAARGMGAEHVRGLVKAGAKVVATDIRDDEGQALAKELGHHVVYARLDITDERAAVRAFQRRFRPKRVDGEIDGQCGALLFELLLERDAGRAT